MSYDEQVTYFDILDARGHVLIPRGLFRAVDIRPGDRVEIVADTATGVLTIRKLEDVAPGW